MELYSAWRWLRVIGFSPICASIIVENKKALSAVLKLRQLTCADAKTCQPGIQRIVSSSSFSGEQKLLIRNSQLVFKVV
jgi:hypothetical protein